MVQSVMPSLTGPFILGGAGAEREGSDGGGSRGGGRSSGSIRPMTNEECGIREVWAHNMEEEFHHIRRVVQQFPYVAMEYDFCEAVDSAVGIYNKMSVVTWRETGNHVRVTKKDDDLDLPLGQSSSEATLSAALQIGDTEFPGVVARPIGEFRSNADYQYQLLRCNVDLLKIIQLGLTFLDEQGKTPPGYSTWQFNFKFNLTEDMYAQDSIDLLQNSGLQFKKHEEDGIEPVDFAELLMTSGIVLVDNVKMLSFHSGYDFGYLLKLLTDQNLPAEESDFFELLRIYFPSIYDVKYLMKSCKNLKGGLQEVAEQLELERVGPQHQAGSDSLLTGAAFFKMKEMFFEDKIDDAKYCGHLYGLGTSFVVNGNSASAYNDNGHTSDSTSNS